MWIFAPLIYFLSWRSCRNLGQAFSETAAWAVGYLLTAGVILAFNWGNVNIIDDRPDGIGSVVALIGGFVAMGVSRWLWKRRGGHLLRRAPVPWMQLAGRTFRAMRATPNAARPRGSAPATAARVNGAANRPRPNGTPSATRSNGTTPRPVVTSADVQKVMSNRWVRGSVRALGAMLSDPNAKKDRRR